jgi:hypothetical protein
LSQAMPRRRTWRRCAVRHSYCSRCTDAIYSPARAAPMLFVVQCGGGTDAM